MKGVVLGISFLALSIIVFNNLSVFYNDVWYSTKMLMAYAIITLVMAVYLINNDYHYKLLLGGKKK